MELMVWNLTDSDSVLRYGTSCPEGPLGTTGIIEADVDEKAFALTVEGSEGISAHSSGEDLAPDGARPFPKSMFYDATVTIWQDISRAATGGEE